MSSGPSKVIVLDPDPRAGRLVQLGFEREGVPTLVPTIAADAASVALDGELPGIVLVGGSDKRSLDLIKRAKTWLAGTHADVPIVYTGRGLARRELEAAGADEVIAHPVYLRDVVTLGRVLRGVPTGQRDHLVGSLAETTGVLTLVRAFSALGRSAVLTLIRGLRRGEVRFYHGEVTSAQVGLIHGQAALHQLLLWTDARFDYAHEDIVRRQQIPLSPEELYADAESFLDSVREHAGNLSPATVLEQDVVKIQSLGKQIPTEVHGVLRMFDGHRVLADVIEDSPYRVFETLRVAQKAVEVGLLKEVQSQRPKATWRAVLAIEEWLVGNETRDAVVERTANLDSGPNPTRKYKKRRNKRMKAPAPTVETKGDIDWGALVPRVIGAEVGPLSGVVPAQQTHGEVELPTRDHPREGLEALMDTEKRQKIFPTEIGLEPKIVIDLGGDAPTPEPAETAAPDVAPATSETPTQPLKPSEIDTAPSRRRKRGNEIATADTPPAGMPAVAQSTSPADDAKPADDAEAKEWADVAARAKADAEAKDADARAASEAEAKEWAAAAARADAAAKADAETKAKADADAKAKAEADAQAKAAADRAAAESARAKAQADAQAKAAADRAAAEKAAAESARAKAQADAQAKAAADRAAAEKAAAEKAAADRAAAEKAAADRAAADKAAASPAQSRLARLPAKPPGADDETDAGTANLVAVPTYVGEMKSDPVAAVTAVSAEASGPRERRSGGTDANDLVRALVAEAIPPTSVPDAISGAVTKPVRPVEESVTTPFIRPTAEELDSAPVPKQPAPPQAQQPPSASAMIAEPIIVSEGRATSVATADVVTVKSAGDTAVVTASPRVLISEQPAIAPVASTEPARTAATPAPAATPAATIVASHVQSARATTADVARATDAAPQAAEDEPSDGVIKTTIAAADTARLARARQRPSTPEHDGPPIKETTGEIRERKPRQTAEPPMAEPSILVADLAAAHDAIASVAAKAAATPAPPADAASASRELAVSETRRDAVAFSDTEEAFFNRAERTAPTPKLESFDDLDEGYQPAGFWDRVFGRKKPPKP